MTDCVVIILRRERIINQRLSFFRTSARNPPHHQRIEHSFELHVNTSVSNKQLILEHLLCDIRLKKPQLTLLQRTRTPPKRITFPLL